MINDQETDCSQPIHGAYINRGTTIGTQILAPEGPVVGLNDDNWVTDTTLGFREVAVAQVIAARAAQDSTWLTLETSSYRQLVSIPNQAPIAMYQGKLEFGYEGASHVMLFDVGRGQTVSVPACFARFSVRNTSDFFGGGEQYVRGHFAIGQRPGAYKPTISQSRDIEAGERATFQAPPFAITWAMYRLDSTISFEVENIPLGAFPNYTATCPVGVNFCNGDSAQTKSLSVLNTGAGPTRFTVVWGLNP